MPSLAEFVAAMAGWFDPDWAEPWDAVGLVCGDPGEQVDRVLLAVDAVPATVEQAIGLRAQLLITHHPLLLTGVHGVGADTAKGALVHRMIRGGLAHLVAHTNADVASPGVSDALGARLGLQAMRPLDAQPDSDCCKLVTFVAVGAEDRVIDALARAGAGSVGAYDRCAFTSQGTGTFRPLAGAAPTIGTVGTVERVDERRIEMLVPGGRAAAVVAALRAAHPYEEPAFDLLMQVPLPSRRGTGRVGELRRPTTLRELTAFAAAALPATVWGVRAAGDPDRVIRTVAVCGGSGGSLAATARASGADVLITADLRHHPALEETAERGDGIALVDAAHWATEAPWLDDLAPRLRERFGTSVEVEVSRRPTDPWTLHEPSVVEGTQGKQ